MSCIFTEKDNFYGSDVVPEASSSLARDMELTIITKILRVEYSLQETNEEKQYRRAKIINKGKITYETVMIRNSRQHH